MIRHLVALRFAQGTSAATKAALYADRAAHQAHIAGIFVCGFGV